jgi:hypothetical protein
LKAAVTLHAVAGGDHSLQVRGKKGPEAFDALLDTVAAWIRDRVGGPASDKATGGG